MNIAIITDSFLPYICGTTTHTVALVQGLVREKHRVLVIAPKPKHPIQLPEAFEAATVSYLPSIPVLYADLRVALPNTPLVSATLARFKPDIIHTQTPLFSAIDAIPYAKLRGIGLVSSFHTLFATPEYLSAMFKIRHAAVLVKPTWGFMRWFYNAHDRVYVATARIESMVQEHGFVKRKLERRVPLVDIYLTAPLTDSRRQLLKKRLKLKKHVAVYIGRISREKNLAMLLSVWKDVVLSMPDSSLLIIGGVYEREMHRLVLAQKLDKHVVMTGALPHENIIESGILYLADIFVSCSTTETLGLSTIESMAHGVPAIVADAQGMNEVVGGGGIICHADRIESFTAAIIKLFADDGLRERMGKNGQQVAEKFTGKENLLGYLRSYRKVIQQKKTMRQYF